LLNAETGRCPTAAPSVATQVVGEKNSRINASSRSGHGVPRVNEGRTSRTPSSKGPAGQRTACEDRWFWHE